MNVASRELCEELYELSGWRSTDWVWARHEKTGEYRVQWIQDTDTGYYWVQDGVAYDLGYLLDKMVERKTGLTLYHVHSTMQWECFYAGKFFEYGTDTQHWETQDSNPANAACKLAIELFKQGILTPTNKEKE